MPALSRRAYARSRNISEAAVRRHVASGVLADALTPEGLIDADRADALLRDSVTRKSPGKVPAVLKTARQRRQRARARAQEDELVEMRSTLIAPADAERLLAGTRAEMAVALRRLPPTAAPLVAGRPATEAHQLLRAAVNAAIGEAGGPDKEPAPETPAPELDLDHLSQVDLTALIAHQQAERMELERAVAQGSAVHIHDLIAAWEEQLGISKSLMLALPGRVATKVEFADVTEAEAILGGEVERAIAALNA